MFPNSLNIAISSTINFHLTTLNKACICIPQDTAGFIICIFSKVCREIYQLSLFASIYYSLVTYSCQSKVFNFRSYSVFIEIHFYILNFLNLTHCVNIVNINQQITSAFRCNLNTISCNTKLDRVGLTCSCHCYKCIINKFFS